MIGKLTGIIYYLVIHFYKKSFNEFLYIMHIKCKFDYQYREVLI